MPPRLGQISSHRAKRIYLRVYDKMPTGTIKSEKRWTQGALKKVGIPANRTYHHPLDTQFTGSFIIDEAPPQP